LSAGSSNPRHVFECAKSWREVLQMSNVTRLRHALPLGQDINAAVTALDNAIADAVDAAKTAGLPQGLVVSLLHGHAHAQTHQMVTV
jgi:hypothetical protein